MSDHKESRLTRISFPAQDAVSLFFQPTSSAATGWDPVYEADACGSPGKKAWEMWLFESSPGVGYVKVYHRDRPTGAVKVPLSSIKSYEERWAEEPYKSLLLREAAAAKAGKEAKEAAALTEADKAVAKK